MMDYDISEDHLEAATKITPGMQSPTIAPSRWLGGRTRHGA